MDIGERYYSLAHVKAAVVLLARSMVDCETGVQWHAEIDRESFRDGEDVNRAWERLRDRNKHLLQPPKECASSARSPF